MSDEVEGPASTADPAGAPGSASSTEVAIRDALRQVVDPELATDVIKMGLIRDILIGPTEVEIQMILTTPFCPYGEMMVQEVKEAAAAVVSVPVKVTLLDEMWSPSMMEGGDWSAWGLT
jgi:metal-sulfur cluster biosynthetic enzyme